MGKIVGNSLVRKDKFASRRLACLVAQEIADRLASVVPGRYTLFVDPEGMLVIQNAHNGSQSAAHVRAIIEGN
jgi:hypothetical protein